jgi:TonB family protein
MRLVLTLAVIALAAIQAAPAAAQAPVASSTQQFGHLQTVSAGYRKRLFAWLEAHKHYPEGARERGEQGRVALRFRVARSGRVLDYVVVGSSGYPDLDAAAEEMMRGAMLPPFPIEMTAPEIEASVTIRFELEASTAPPIPEAAPASQGPIALVPQAARPSFPVLGDNLDQWCSQVRLPSSIAVCSDRDLRALAIERQHAFDTAKARLSPDQQKALLADQNGWVRTYPQACGVMLNAPPALPLAPAIKDCMAEAGRARIAYLRAYGVSGEAANATAQTAAPSGQELDPLLDAEHKVLVKRAFDFCDVRPQTERCRVTTQGLAGAGPQWSTEELVKNCPQIGADTVTKACPDGPEKLAADWEANRRASTVTFREFVLDKEQMSQPGEYGVHKLVEIRGVYIRAADNMDYLLAPGEINPMAFGRNLNSDVAVPLLINDSGPLETDRATRANLLACRQRHPPETFTGCSVLLEGFVEKCKITIFLTGASHEEVCINVGEAIIDPRS